MLKELLRSRTPSKKGDAPSRPLCRTAPRAELAASSRRSGEAEFDGCGGAL